jgi:hypothetical protein
MDFDKFVKTMNEYSGIEYDFVCEITKRNEDGSVVVALYEDGGSSDSDDVALVTLSMEGDFVKIGNVLVSPVPSAVFAICYT